jgi:hypothetical protein
MHFRQCYYFSTIAVYFCIVSNLQLIIPKVPLNAGMPSVAVAVILSLAFSLDYSIILNLLVFSFFKLSFMC